MDAMSLLLIEQLHAERLLKLFELMRTREFGDFLIFIIAFMPFGMGLAN